jgi:phytoene dehydrogenase-like protein
MMKLGNFKSFRNFCTKRMIQHKLLKNPKSESYSLEKNKEIDTRPFIYGEKYNTSILEEKLNATYDVIIVGAGHNGLVCANYLAEQGKKVLVLEKRHTVGGCAVTEELVEGYKLSRCSYVLSLFRKKIIDELFPKEFYEKIKLHKRNPKGLTPTKEVDKYLVRRSERDLLKKEIAKFSKKDAENIDKLDDFLNKMVKIVEPLIDMTPPKKISPFDINFLKFAFQLARHTKDLYKFYHFLTADAEYYLDKYLESDILKGTFATDAVIGAMKSPRSTGSAYVLLHHVMGTLDDEGSWFYVEGGNGAISNFLADQAVKRGVTIALNTPVEKFMIEENKIKGIQLVMDSQNNSNQNHIQKVNAQLNAKTYVVNCDLYTTYYKLLNENDRKDLLSEELIKGYDQMGYTSPVMKINLIVDKLPKFKCLEKVYQEYQDDEKVALDHLTGTIHMNSESIEAIHNAYVEAMTGKPSTRPIIEMTIPSILDKTLVPKNSNHHVIGLFCQYAPNKLNTGSWTLNRKREYASRIYDEIDKYAPGFSKSILFDDILSPADLEQEFSIRGGNIFHGVMDLSSIFFCRPFPGASDYKQPINNLYSCSAAMHPGGGVMGAAGRNCAINILQKSNH